MATLAPDAVYLRGKSAPRHQPVRPEVSLCRACLLTVLRPELARYAGRAVAFEPDAEVFSQYFFLADEDFAAAGVEPAVAAAIAQRLRELAGSCEECPASATWLWVSRREVSNLDDTTAIAAAAGQRLCALHGAQALCDSFESIAGANLFYINVPYGDAGSYLWI